MVSHKSAPLALVLGALAATQGGLTAQISDPLPPVEWSDITINITEFSQLPSSSGSKPRAEINHLKPAGDGSGRLFANDLNGKMYLVSEGDAALYLDLEDEVGSDFKDAPGLGTGFTSFSFHPDFVTNGKFYTAHSEDPGSGAPDFVLPNTSDSVALQGVVIEWTATTPGANVFAGSRREIMRVNISGTIHGMQEIEFNPNATPGSSDYGMLYICIGDGGSTIGGYPENTSRLDSVQGTILRIDPMGTNSANGNYGIPADNPWASDGDEGTFGEIWAYGFRNPHRITWDTGGDKIMLAATIGERNIEEVNLIEPGNHYGWNKREGTFVINPDFARNPGAGTNDDIFPLPADDASFGYTYPVAQYDHDEGAAIAGGYVYRGTVAPHMVGQYICGEITDGELYVVDTSTIVQGQQTEIKKLHLKLDGVTRTMQQIIGDSRTDIRFGYDEDNELYITEKREGKIYKIIGSEGPDIEPPPEGEENDLINISTRGLVGVGGEIMIAGFVSAGDAASGTVLIRGIGPTLGSFGVANTVEDPVLTVFRTEADGSSTQIATNDDWGDSQAIADASAAVGAFALAAGSKDAAILLSGLTPGAYTVQLSGKGTTEQNGLIEVYRVD